MYGVVDMDKWENIITNMISLQVDQATNFAG
jgi:hypothetical protein